MFSDQSGLFNPALFSQEYFERLLEVVYRGVKVKSIVAFSAYDMTYESTHRIFYGFVSSNNTQVNGDGNHIPGRFSVYQRGKAIETDMQVLALFDSTRKGTDPTEFPVNFIGWIADVETPVQQSDDTTPVVTGALSARILKIIHAGTDVYMLVHYGEDDITLCVGDDESLPVGSASPAIEWLLFKSYAAITHAPNRFVRAYKDNKVFEAHYIDTSLSLKAYTHVVDGTRHKFFITRNQLFSDSMEFAGLKINIACSNPAFDETIWVNAPLASDDSLEAVVNTDLYPLLVGITVQTGYYGPDGQFYLLGQADTIV